MRLQDPFAAMLAGAIAFTTVVAPGADPLPSWNDGKARQAIVAFVEAATGPGAPGFVPVAERIAVFDNDGTLWAEQPIYVQVAFALDRVKALAPQHPEWREKQPFKAALEGDLGTVFAGGEHALLDLVMATHAGNTTEEFTQIVEAWLATAKHPRFKRPCTECVYQAMLELRDGRPVIVRLPEVDFIDDKEGKPVAIQKFIGRRPIAAFGNSDGDLQMLQWTAAGAGPRFCLLVRHTDADREWAYDRESKIGRLDQALDQASRDGWTVVDMKKDWKRVFPFE